MKTDSTQTVMEIMSRLEDVRLREKHGGRFRFRLYMTPPMCAAPIDTLDLGTRSLNCLKRGGYGTVGQLVDSLAEGVDLKTIRSCGAMSEREIKEHLFLYHYYSMKPEKRNEYLIETVLLNLTGEQLGRLGAEI